MRWQMMAKDRAILSVQSSKSGGLPPTNVY